MANELQPSELRTDECRASYAHVWEPKVPPRGTKPKYSISLVFPKTANEMLNRIKKCLEAALNEGISKKWGGKKPPTLKFPIRDGDKERPNDPTYAGMYFFNANSDRQPGIVDIHRNKIITPDEFYSGCYCRAFVNFYPFSVSGSNGIAVGLQHLQKTRDGERLQGGVDLGSAFADDWGGVEESSIADLSF